MHTHSFLLRGRPLRHQVPLRQLGNDECTAGFVFGVHAKDPRRLKAGAVGRRRSVPEHHFLLGCLFGHLSEVHHFGLDLLAAARLFLFFLARQNLRQVFVDVEEVARYSTIILFLDGRVALQDSLELRMRHALCGPVDLLLILHQYLAVLFAIEAIKLVDDQVGPLFGLSYIRLRDRSRLVIDLVKVMSDGPQRLR